jgi:hypothetical protein
MYEVFAEYDGCINEAARFTGTQDECLAYMRKHKAPRFCSWALVNTLTRRCVSYML